MKKWVMVAVLCITLACLQAQPRYHNLVMEGGGIRGIAYVGALQVLDSMGHLATLKRVGGTSAGAIQACLLAVGYTPAEMLAVLKSTSFKQFNDGSFLAVPGAIRFRKHMGWYRGDRFLAWMQELIAAKTGNGRMSFEELHRWQVGKQLPQLFITGTDLTWQRLRVFSYESYPAMQLGDAVRISASIPFYFQPIWMDGEGKCFTENDPGKGRSLVVDGGLLANYPISLFDSSRYVSVAADNKFERNAFTLGLQLEEPWLVDSPALRMKQPFPIENNNTYLKSIYKLLVDKPVFDLDRTVLISNLALSPRIRKLPLAQVNALLESGRVAARIHLQKQ